MHRRYHRLTGLVLCMWLFCPLAVYAEPAVRPTVEAMPAIGSITIDGQLDEPAWQHAGVIEDLTQQSPHPGQPTPFHTKLLLLHDGHTLYLGVIADGLLSPTPAINSNNGVDYNWDGIWTAAVRRNPHGWTAEIAIDTRSLQFCKHVSAWGFNITRNVP